MKLKTPKCHKNPLEIITIGPPKKVPTKSKKYLEDSRKDIIGLINENETESI
jgi:hypothetical protein